MWQYSRGLPVWMVAMTDGDLSYSGQLLAHALEAFRVDGVVECERVIRSDSLVRHPFLDLIGRNVCVFHYKGYDFY